MSFSAKDYVAGDIDKLVSSETVSAVATVQKHGINDVSFRVFINGNHIWQYTIWQSMLKRCFCSTYKITNPTYIGVNVCDDWLLFSNFFAWINKEVCYTGRPFGMELDKDILIRGNKVYSPETCCLIPQQVNKLLNNHSRARGELPVGVCYYPPNGKYRVQMNFGGVVRHLGYYYTPEEAFAAYKIAKEAHIKLVALQHKDTLKPAAFESLMNWEIEP